MLFSIFILRATATGLEVTDVTINSIYILTTTNLYITQNRVVVVVVAVVSYCS